MKNEWPNYLGLNPIFFSKKTAFRSHTIQLYSFMLHHRAAHLKRVGIIGYCIYGIRFSFWKNDHNINFWLGAYFGLLRAKAFWFQLKKHFKECYILLSSFSIFFFKSVIIINGIKNSLELFRMFILNFIERITFLLI